MPNPPIIHVLLAEDNPEDVALVIKFLAQIQIAQYKLEQVATYDAVLEGLARQQYDVYLIASCLGGQSGLDALQTGEFSLHKAAMLFLGSCLAEASIVRSHHLDYLYKPDLTPALLDYAIQHAMNWLHLPQPFVHTLQAQAFPATTLESLQKSEEQYRLAIQSTDDGIWDWDLATNEIYFSPQWQALIGRQTQAVTGQPDIWFERIHPEDLYWVKREITAHLNGLSLRFESGYRLKHQDGQYRWMLNRGKAIRNSSGKAVRMIGIQTDITEFKRAEEKLIHDALYDTLTGLPNRVSLMERLRRTGELVSRNQEYLFAILFIDLDRFKMINDSLGHAIGDLLLQEIAYRLSLCLRPDDTIARLGGDEFVILLEDVKNRDNAISIAERILHELSTPFNLEGREIFTTASIGITFGNSELDHPEDLLRDADLAMYRAKTQGRGHYEIFHPRMHTSAIALLEMETDLRRALERQELQLHYQPIVSLRTNRLVGFEALIRWQHPQQGLVSPAKFIPIAEETGLIASIGGWVLQEACMQMRRWQKQFPEWQSLIINVNLSSKQFTPHLVEQVHQTLQETGLDAQSLKLEITESTLMGNANSAIAMLTQLKQLGIQLAIDDFGTGYSSLSYLHRFPIDTLKVDRSFINKVDVDGEQLAIVRTIITLAWNLGMEVVAEGVETPKQLAQLRSLRCEYAQGYLFSKPGDAAAIESLLMHDLESGQFKISSAQKSAT